MSNYYQRRENGDGTYSENVALTDSDAIVPVYIEGRRQKTVQQLSASVLPSAWQSGPWIDTDGYDKIGCTLLNDAATNSRVSIEYSNDGVTKHGAEDILLTATTKERKGIVETGARFARLSIQNGDTVAHTINVWAYLKS